MCRAHSRDSPGAPLLFALQPQALVELAIIRNIIAWTETAWATHFSL